MLMTTMSARTTAVAAAENDMKLPTQSQSLCLPARITRSHFTDSISIAPFRGTATPNSLNKWMK